MIWGDGQNLSESLPKDDQRQGFFMFCAKPSVKISQVDRLIVMFFTNRQFEKAVDC
jgi:hypothetical protein